MASNPPQATATTPEFTPPRLGCADFFCKKIKIGVGRASRCCNSAPNRVLSAMFSQNGAFNRVWNAVFLQNTAFNRVWNAVFSQNSAFNRV